MTAASRRCGAEGAGGSLGLKVMPIDSVTLSDGHGRGRTRADPPIWTVGVFRVITSCDAQIRVLCGGVARIA
jgi:hypothetical protein